MSCCMASWAKAAGANARPSETAAAEIPGVMRERMAIGGSVHFAQRDALNVTGPPLSGRACRQRQRRRLLRHAVLLHAVVLLHGILRHGILGHRILGHRIL